MRAACGWTVRVVRVPDGAEVGALRAATWDVEFVAEVDGGVRYWTLGNYSTREAARAEARAELARLRLDLGAVARLREQARRRG